MPRANGNFVPLGHFKVDEEGSRMLDRATAIKTSGNTTIAYFRPDSTYWIIAMIMPAEMWGLSR